MADRNHNPNPDGLIPPLDPNICLNGPNLAQLVLMAIEAVALGMDPKEAAKITGIQLHQVMWERLEQYSLTVLSIPSWVGEGGQN